MRRYGLTIMTGYDTVSTNLVPVPHQSAPIAWLPLAVDIAVVGV